MKQIVDWVVNITDKLGALIGISGFITRLIILGLLLLIIAMIIAGCVRHRKKKKAKKLAEQKKTETKPIEVKTEEKPVVEEVKAEEKPAIVVAATETPVEVEEKAKEPVEVKEEVKVEEKAKPEKKEPAKKETAKKETKKAVGKWVIFRKSDKEYIAELFASNGEVMLTSETYTTASGAEGGIATIIKGVEADSFVIYQDKKNNFYYKLKNANNRLLCVGEIYTTKDQCQKAVESVKRLVKTAVKVPEINESEKYVDYTPVDIKSYDGKAKGKWKIESTDGGKYLAKLFASNGQLMLATEEVASKKTVLNAIESVKKNAVDGNFIIDKDKFGRFYYKLRNAQKSVICIGESYDRLDACVSALESVRRFAYTAPTDNL